jgi:hypothetical protein
MESGESTSTWVHCTPLQLLLEVGIGLLIIPLSLWLVRKPALLERSASTQTTLPPTDPRPLFAGVLLACLLAPFLARGTTLLPLHLELPLLDGVLCALIVGGSLFVLARFAPRGGLFENSRITRGLLVGCGAFLIHSLIDFDLYSPGVAVTFGVVLGLAGQGQLIRSRNWAPLAAGLCLLLALLSTHFAVQRDETARLFREASVDSPSEESAAQAVDQLISMWPMPGHAIAFASTRFGPRLAAQGLKAFDGLAPSVANRPLHQLWRLRLLQASATDAASARRILSQVTVLKGEPLEAEILLIRSDLFTLAGDLAEAASAKQRAEDLIRARK